MPHCKWHPLRQCGAQPTELSLLLGLHGAALAMNRKKAIVWNTSPAPIRNLISLPFYYLPPLLVLRNERKGDVEEKERGRNREVGGTSWPGDIELQIQGTKVSVPFYFAHLLEPQIRETLGRWHSLEWSTSAQGFPCTRGWPDRHLGILTHTQKSSAVSTQQSGFHVLGGEVVWELSYWRLEVNKTKPHPDTLSFSMGLLSPSKWCYLLLVF